jgi:hypothetical protein
MRFVHYVNFNKKEAKHLEDHQAYTESIKNKDKKQK